MHDSVSKGKLVINKRLLTSRKKLDQHGLLRKTLFLNFSISLISPVLLIFAVGQKTLCVLPSLSSRNSCYE